MLQEEVAWRIATTWKTELSGCIGLVISAQDDLQSVIPSYKWVEFKLSGGSRSDLTDLASLQNLWNAAQAASVAWTMLTCCKGYAGHENPVFWRRVICEYMKPKRFGPDITDATKFFVRGAFPCFQLSVGSDVVLGGLGIFFGRVLAPHDANEVRAPVEELAPYVLPHRLRRDIDVCLAIPSGQTSVVETVQDVRDVIGIAKAHPWAHGLVQYAPRFVINQFELTQQRVRTEADVDAMVGLFRDLSISSPRLAVKLDPQLPVQAVTKLFRPIASVELADPSSRISDLTLDCELLSEQHLGAMCSVLPYARSLETLRLHIDDEKCDSSLVTHLSSWLDYALRHPSAARSSWKNLDLKLSPNTLDKLHETNATTDNDVMHRVTIAPGSIIRAEPHLHAAQLVRFDDSVLDVCSWVSDTKRHWTSVIVPGYGRCWVANEDVTATESKPWAGSRLRGLAWTIWPSDERASSRLALKFFLDRYGALLRTLLVVQPYQAAAYQVHDILHATPALESFKIHHDGSFACSDDLPASFRTHHATLREVVLVPRTTFDLFGRTWGAKLPSQTAMDGPLANLQALALFDVDHDAAKEFLKRNPRLQFLHLTKKRYFCEDYQATRHKTRAALGVNNQEYASSQAPFRPECQRAFLGVLKRLDLDALENGVVRQIFAFASSNVEREVWADDTGRYISLAMTESRGPRHIYRRTAPSPEPSPEPQRSFWSRLLG